MYTCHHLGTKLARNPFPHWYASCEIGDGASRLRWVASIDPVKLRRVTALREAMADMNASVIRQLWELKGQQLRELLNNEDPAPVTRQMELLAGQFIDQTDGFLKEHAKQLADLKLPGEAVVELLNASLEDFITQKGGEVSWRVPDEALSRYPDPVQLFFRPPSAGTTGAAFAGGRSPESLTQ